MALVTISGYPCAGKSQRATQIKDHLERRIADRSCSSPSLSVTIVSDDTLKIPRSAYDDSSSEKLARGALLTTVQRRLGSDRIVIVDSLNYIKGFRYQLYCAAREAKVRVCTVYVIAPPEQCREWNKESYSLETLENLIQRYEEPSSMARWDSPLFTVPWTDPDVPADDIWHAITQGLVKPPNTGTQAVTKAPTDALHALESATTALVSAIVTAQSTSSLPGGALILDVPVSARSITLRITLPARHVTLSELQRLKRQFVAIHKRAVTLGTTEKGEVDWSEESVSRKFIVYLEENAKS